MGHTSTWSWFLIDDRWFMGSLGAEFGWKRMVQPNQDGIKYAITPVGLSKCLLVQYCPWPELSYLAYILDGKNNEVNGAAWGQLEVASAYDLWDDGKFSCKQVNDLWSPWWQESLVFKKLPFDFYTYSTNFLKTVSKRYPNPKPNLPKYANGNAVGILLYLC